MPSPLENPFPKVLDYSRQGVEAPGTRRPGQTGHYQNGLWGLITLEKQNHIRTVPDIFNLGYSLAKDQPFLGHRKVLSRNPLTFGEYVWITYAQADERRRNLGSALEILFRDGVLGGGEYPTVGIWSQNRPEWQIIDNAISAYKKVSVSLYDTLGKDAVEYIIGHSHLTVVFVTLEHIPTLLSISRRIPMLKMIVSIDDLSEEIKKVLTAWGKVLNMDVKELRELEAMGQANRLEPIPVVPDDLVSICYTSGTTNNPKGVLLTHGTLATAAMSNLHGADISEAGCLISYLPLAHIYERNSELNVIAVGGRIGYFTGDPLRLLEDAQALKPNFFPSVPRVLNRVYQMAMLAGQVPGIKGYLFRKALETKLNRLHETGINTHAFWDKLVFRKVQAVLGGQIKLLTCGSAPISADAMDFLKVAFACDVVEGYGMTENCGTCTRVWPFDPTSSGTVGAPQPCNEIKLVDVPSMGYTANDKPNPRGEICVRGGNCFSVYYKDEKNTRETIDPEGWLHTGDVGEVDSVGRFKIIDRIKNIMKLSQGEYVALEKVENAYGGAGVLAQLYVHGDSLQSYLVGVVVPDPEQFAPLVTRVTGNKVGPTDLAALLAASKDPRVRDCVLDELSNHARKVGLKGFETVKKIHIELEPFSPENGLLTPTLKLRRRDAYEKYKAELEALYSSPASNGGAAPKL
ncbi:acetyl-CoA synthetase-like protein [Rickenella mellea]|uniref:Acetyl-CoA synthetase-like protein n=1 Tax=Rickenella mellea TaxID=50990 RepID=A0A4Y7QK66_9AGAM|nr:acetyl-CoA synthetase-like protein [Rickenella mellea]